VDEPVLFLAGGILEADLRPPGLEVAEVRARAHLQPLVAAGRPDFEVELHHGREGKVSRAHLDDPVRQAEVLENIFGIRQQPL
jgi:hypothetical protein